MMNYDSLKAYMDGLYADGTLSEYDYNKIIVYILANGDIENSPRDLIQVRRGNESNIPLLAQGELAFCLDSENFYIGGISNNVKLTNNKANKYLFIADSYDMYSNWINETAKKLGLIEGKDYWNLGLSGSSFAGGSWLYQVQNWVASHPSEVKNIGFVVCGGGINDSDAVNYPKLANAMQTFSNYCKGALPSSKVKLAFFGWCLDNSPIISGRIGDYRIASQMLYSRAQGFGMQYLTGCELVLHHRQLLDIDGLHPNAEGGRRIAESISNALTIGNSAITYKERAIFTSINGTQTGYIEQTIFSNQLVTSFVSFNINACNFVFQNNAYTKIGDVELMLGNKIPETLVNIMMQTSTGNIWVNAYIKILNDELLCRVFEIDSSTGTFVSITATIIHSISLAITQCAMND